MIQRKIIVAYCFTGFALLGAVNPADAHDDTIHFSHPLIAESPTPDTKVRLDYQFRDIDAPGEEGVTHTVRLEAEYAFHDAFGIELDVPYVFAEPDAGLSEGNFDNIEVGLKFANFAFEDKSVVLGYGLEFGLPTGDDDKGIGSDNEFVFEPFFNVGYKYDDLEVISYISFGIPINQNGGEVETELGYNLAVLYPVAARITALAELDLETVLSGDESGHTVINLTPGIKFRPLDNAALEVGLGASFPVSNEEEFNIQTLLSVFYHF